MEGDGHIGLWEALGGFLITLGLAVTAERGRYAWGRGVLTCCLLSFALPLAGRLFAGIVDGQGFAKVSKRLIRVGQRSAQCCQASLFLTSAIMSASSWGVIFLIGSYFTLRRGSQNWPNPTTGA
jgi:hypothetical protein